MQYAQCHHNNSATVKFREECGTKLVRVCPACGFAVNPEAKFCAACGTPLPRQSRVQDLTSSVQKTSASERQIVDSGSQTLDPRPSDPSLEEGEHRQLTVMFFWFTEGFDTADLKDAKALLDALSEGH